MPLPWLSYIYWLIHFKIYSTDPAILNDSNFSNKSNDNIGNKITGAQSNKDLIEALKSKLQIWKFLWKKN